MVLGKWNQADQTTTIKNIGSGPALDIRAEGPGPRGPQQPTGSRTSTPTSSTARTPRPSLTNQADTIYVDGATSRVGGFTQSLPAQPAGSYLVAYSAQIVRRRRQPRPTPTP